MNNQDLSTHDLVKKALGYLAETKLDDDADTLLWDAITRLLQERDAARAEVVKIRRLLELMGIDIDAVPEPPYKPGDAVIHRRKVAMVAGWEHEELPATVNSISGYKGPVYGWEYVIRYGSGFMEMDVNEHRLRPADSPAPDNKADHDR